MGIVQGELLTFEAGVLIQGDNKNDIKDFLVGSDYADTLSGYLEADTLYGGSGDDRLAGGAGADRLIGGTGADMLYGGSGDDRLAGGAGADSFVFDWALGANNVDRITDFNATEDLMCLDTGTFLALSTGALASNAFMIGTAATNAAHRIIYDQATGQLFYDANGIATGGQTLLAILTPGASLTAADFIIV